MKRADEQLSAREELIVSERVLARDGKTECELLGRRDVLKDDRERLLARYSGDQLPASARSRVSAMDSELLEIEGRLAGLTPKVLAAQNRAAEIKGSFVAVAHARLRSMVHDAVLGAPSRARYLAESTKLAGVLAELGKAKGRLGKLQADARTRLDREDKATEFLRTGAVSEGVPQATPAEIQKAAENVAVIERAVELQGATTDSAKGDFTGELAAALLPIREELLKRIRDGFSAAAEATAEVHTLSGLTRDATGGNAVQVPVYFGVQPITPDGAHPFSSWLRQLRIEGYEV